MHPPIVIDLDTTVCRLSAIKKAAYRFGDRCYAAIESTAPNTARVTLTPKRTLDNIDHLAGEFRNEALDQELREVVARETEGVRNLILAQAFSAISLIHGDADTADYRDDPLHIQTPDVPHQAPRHE